jgi:hypothetical protein
MMGDEEAMGRESEIKRRMMRNFVGIGISDVAAFGGGKKNFHHMIQ